MIKNDVKERIKSKRKYSIVKNVWAWIMFLRIFVVLYIKADKKVEEGGI